MQIFHFNIIFNGVKTECFHPLRTETWQGHFYFSFSIVLEILGSTIWLRKKLKAHGLERKK
jgi:hypothetical protein